MDYTFCVPCLMGAEGLLADELKFTGFKDVVSENARVYFKGDLREGARANVTLRCGERVLLRLAEFRALSFEELFQGTYKINWGDILPFTAAYPVAGYSLNSKLFSVPDCQRIIKKAVSKKLGEKYSFNFMPENGVKHQIRFSIIKDKAEIFLDTTGTPLHKRGYRPAHTEASMSETLAATVVKVSRWRGREPLVDPLCGAGTLAIEAAMAALKIPPGGKRFFDSESWPIMGKELYAEVKAEENAKILPGPISVTASDIDPAAVEMARGNAFRAGVGEHIDFRVADATKLSYPSEGVLMTDPPYGVRLMDPAAAANLVKALGKTVGRTNLKKYILSADEDFETHFGFKADKKRKLYNGMIKCNLYMYFK